MVGGDGRRSSGGEDMLSSMIELKKSRYDDPGFDNLTPMLCRQLLISLRRLELSHMRLAGADEQSYVVIASPGQYLPEDTKCFSTYATY